MFLQDVVLNPRMTACKFSNTLGQESPSHGPPSYIINHSLPTSVVVKNGWRYTSALPICLHGEERDNFTWLKIGLFIPPSWRGTQKTTGR